MKLLVIGLRKNSNICGYRAMSNAELATGYAALILADEGLEITADKLQTLTKAAGIEVESIWSSLFAKALEGKDVKDLLLNVGGMKFYIQC
jgi:large subunit ribosomal protein LP1